MYEENWNKQEVVDNWAKSKLPDIPKTTDTTIYIRNLHIFNLGDSTAFMMSIGYVSGIIIYINGEEVYRRNLPKYI